jgi:hypothetical protein
MSIQSIRHVPLEDVTRAESQAPPNPLSLLVRGFLRRFADNDLMAPGTDFAQSVAWIFAFLIALGLVVSAMFTPSHQLLVILSRRFPDIIETSAWRTMTLFIGLTMSASGILAAAAWDSLSLQRRDCLILFALPLEVRTIVLAKLVALVFFSLALAVGTNAAAMVHYGLMSPATTASAFSVARRIVAALASTSCASLFVFWSAVAIQGVLQTTLRPRPAARASEAAQWAIAFASLLLFLVLLLIATRIRVPLLRYDGVHWARLFWLPPVWFLGLYEWLNGSPRPIMRELSALAASGLAAVVGIAVLSYVTAFDRRVRAMIEQPEIVAAARPLAGRVLTRIAWALSKTPAEAALHLFIVRSLVRNRMHRLGLSSALGLGFALVTYGMFMRSGLVAQTMADATPRLLSIPLVLLFCGVWGMRAVFAIPIEAHARWIFELAGDADRFTYVRAARAVVLAWLVMPLCVLTFLVASPLWGVQTAVLHAAYCALLGAALTEVALARLRRIPFTCRWIPGASNFKVLWPVFIYAFAFFAYRMAGLEVWLLASPRRWVMFCAAAGLLTIAAASLYWRRRTDEQPTFDESIEAAVQTLDLQSPVT